MKRFKNIKQVWQALDYGKTVYWSNTLYKLTIEHCNKEWYARHGYDIPWTNRGDKCLRVTCISNYFGSLLGENELSKLFTE